MQLPEIHSLEIDSATLHLGGRSILQGVYLRLETGCITVLLGRNGAGKSCLLKMMYGILRGDFCSIHLDGCWQSRLGAPLVRYLPQHPFIPGGLRVSRVLRDFGLERDDLNAWFPLFAPLGDPRVRTLSGGERRLLECFVILRSASLFVLLDEPFAQVAPVHAERLEKLILAEKARKGVLLTDQLYRMAMRVADRVWVLAEGQTYPCPDAGDLIRYGYLRRS